MSMLAAINLSYWLLASTSASSQTQAIAIEPEPRSREDDVAAARSNFLTFTQLVAEHADKQAQPPAKPSPLRAPCTKCKAAPGEECDMRAYPSRHRFHAARLVAPPEAAGGAP